MTIKLTNDSIVGTFRPGGKALGTFQEDEADQPVVPGASGLVAPADSRAG